MNSHPAISTSIDYQSTPARLPPLYDLPPYNTGTTSTFRSGTLPLIATHKPPVSLAGGITNSAFVGVGRPPPPYFPPDTASVVTNASTISSQKRQSWAEMIAESDGGSTKGGSVVSVKVGYNDYNCDYFLLSSSMET